MLSNNPKKFEGLKDYGIEIVDRIELIVPETQHNHSYMETKKNKPINTNKPVHLLLINNTCAIFFNITSIVFNSFTLILKNFKYILVLK